MSFFGNVSSKCVSDIYTFEYSNDVLRITYNKTNELILNLDDYDLSDLHEFLNLVRGV